VGIGAKDDSGVASTVSQTPNSIGYVQVVYATQNSITFGAVRNSAGNFVKASLYSITAAAAAAVPDIPQDFRVSITNAPGKDAYPISSFAWFLVPANLPSGKRQAIINFLQWMLTKGQQYTDARLPDGLLDMEQDQVAKSFGLPAPIHARQVAPEATDSASNSSDE